MTMERLVKVYPEIPLEAEVEKRVGRYLELEFHKHKAIRMSAEKFKDSLMKLAVSQPENFKGRIDTPVIVCGQIPIKDQCELSGIEYFLSGLDVRDWPEDPQKYKTPKDFYMTWMDEGVRFMNRKVQDVRKELASDERGGTAFDGVALYIAKPNVLQTRFLDLPGTALGPLDGVSLGLLWDGSGRPFLYCSFVDHALPAFGSLVCGRKK